MSSFIFSHSLPHPFWSLCICPSISDPGLSLELQKLELLSFQMVPGQLHADVPQAPHFNTFSISAHHLNTETYFTSPTFLI